MHRVKLICGNRTRGTSIALFVIITALASAAISVACLGTKTTVCERSGLHCEPGQICDVAQDACINVGGCGDGIINREIGSDGNPKEVCDDGNVTSGDGCSEDCKSDETCGNGITDEATGETCDGEPNCSVDCHLQACGNKILDPGEVCDDGNVTPDDGCSANCKSNEACGNGIIDNDGSGGILHEECEFPDAPFPGVVHDSPNCNSDCTLPMCGDGHTNIMYLVTDDGPDHFEECDSGLIGMRLDSSICNSNCTIPRCGDHRINTKFIPSGSKTGEECDEGDQNSDTRPDACRKDCHQAFCGDGVLDTIATQSHPIEECDDGADLNHDLDHDGKINSDTLPNACRMNCRKAFCGDHVVDTEITPQHAKEDCDTGGVDAATCDFDCTTPSCGDHHVNTEAGEICEPGDGSHPQIGCLTTQTCVSTGLSRCKVCID